MSPLQYQKLLRIQTARERMLMDGLDPTTAAYEVGYESGANSVASTADASVNRSGTSKA
jgi:methylphosphotriester-DNA--protein-cysteine methyltransferase